MNRVVDAVRDQVGLESGVALPVWHALTSGSAGNLHALAEQVGAGTARFELPTGSDADRAREAAREAAAAGIARIDANRRRREELVATHGDPPRRPWIYLIVATGDIYEDIPQAQAAARAGADVIAVIRSTGQSLLDYVPGGRHAHRVRRHVRHPGELPADAGGAGRRQRRARPLRPADQLRVAACACRRSPSWPGSSGWT